MRIINFNIFGNHHWRSGIQVAVPCGGLDYFVNIGQVAVEICRPGQRLVTYLQCSGVLDLLRSPKFAIEILMSADISTVVRSPWAGPQSIIENRSFPGAMRRPGTSSYVRTSAMAVSTCSDGRETSEA